jgi:predicted transcriptional regulator of viral defense system
MQPMKYLSDWLDKNIGLRYMFKTTLPHNYANTAAYLFTLQDLRALWPEMSDSAFKALLSRAVNAEILDRVCRGLYIYKRAQPPSGLALFHMASLLRAAEFNYISLETALSDTGVISQIPINWITIMSSGRSSIVSCGKFGTIEFVHTNQKPTHIMNQLSYDASCRLWRASVPLALRDMRVTHRNRGLIDWEVANEFV